MPQLQTMATQLIQKIDLYSQNNISISSEKLIEISIDIGKSFSIDFQKKGSFVHYDDFLSVEHPTLDAHVVLLTSQKNIYERMQKRNQKVWYEEKIDFLMEYQRNISFAAYRSNNTKPLILGSGRHSPEKLVDMFFQKYQFLFYSNNHNLTNKRKDR